MRLPALTLWQPWATLVASGVKRYEFRRWAATSRYRGCRIAIHAGARPMRRGEIDDLLAALRLEQGWGTALDVAPAMELLLRIQADLSIVPLSHVVATAVLGEPVPAAEAVARLYGESFRGDSDRIDHQVWGWPVTDIRRLEPPVPMRGAQGFWPCELDVAA